MKQHITVEQLHEYLELETQAGKTIDFNPNKFDNLSHAIKLPQDTVLTEEMINIGKMIEILQKHRLDKIHTPKTNEVHITLRIVTVPDCEVLYYVKSFEADNICDALWETIKYVIGD